MKVRLGGVRWKAGLHSSRDQVIIINWIETDILDIFNKPLFEDFMKEQIKTFILLLLCSWIRPVAPVPKKNFN